VLKIVIQVNTKNNKYQK